VIGAALCLDAKFRLRPQLALGAETMRSLQDAKQHGLIGSGQSKESGRAVSGLVFLASPTAPAALPAAPVRNAIGCW